MSDAQQLSKLDETSVSELTAVSGAMQTYIQSSTVEARQNAVELLGQQGKVMRRLFPNELTRTQNQIAIAGMRQVAEGKAELLGLYMRTQIEIAKKQADALIAAQGIRIATILARYADEQFSELSQTLMESQSRFRREMKPRLQELDEYKDFPELRDPSYNAILHHIETYFSSCESLLNRFKAALDNKVNKELGK
jgi:hypothetical protein